MQDTPRTGALAEWRIGAPSVFSSFFGMYLCVCFLYSFGVFIGPLEGEFGWNRESISIGLLIVTWIGAAVKPISGLLVDRYGSRRVAIPAVVFFSIAIGLCSLAGSDVRTWWLCCSLVGIGYGLTGYAVWLPGAVSSFDKSRGTAIAIIQVGAGVGLASQPIIATELITTFGWREAYQSFASAGILIVLPIVVLGFVDRRFTRQGRLLSTAEADKQVSGWSRGTILRSPKFWKLSLATVLGVTGLNGMVVHFVPFLRGQGFQPAEAASIAGFIGFGSIAGRVLCGFLLDRVNASRLAAAAFGLPVLFCPLLLLQGDDAGLMSLSALVFGLSIGAEVDVVSYLAVRHFGLRFYGFVLGLLSGAMSIGSGLGAWLGGAIFDSFGSYNYFAVFLTVGFVVAACLAATLGAYVPAEEQSNPASGAERVAA